MSPKCPRPCWHQMLQLPTSIYTDISAYSYILERSTIDRYQRLRSSRRRCVDQPTGARGSGTRINFIISTTVTRSHRTGVAPPKTWPTSRTIRYSSTRVRPRSAGDGGSTWEVKGLRTAGGLSIDKAECNRFSSVNVGRTKWDLLVSSFSGLSLVAVFVERFEHNVKMEMVPYDVT